MQVAGSDLKGCTDFNLMSHLMDLKAYFLKRKKRLNVARGACKLMRKFHFEVLGKYWKYEQSAHQQCRIQFTTSSVVNE